MKKLLYLVFFVGITAYAEGPLYGHKDGADSLEFQNVYQDLRSVKNTSLTISSATANFIQIGSLFSGKVVQVVQGNSSTPLVTNSASFQISNLSAAITPKSAADKIIVFAMGVMANTAGDYCYATLGKNSVTNLASAGVLAIEGSTAFQATGTMIFVDSPATTSATTYQVWIRNTAGAVNVSWGTASTNQIMILIEVAP